MELFIILATIAVFIMSLVRFHKAKKIVINDFPHPETYATPDYANAYSQAFKAKGLEFKHYAS